jgi:hypothetical protein
MGQFGLNMNFLGIKQIVAMIFTLKINFCIIFLDFSFPWTARQLIERPGVSTQNILRLRTPCRWTAG